MGIIWLVSGILIWGFLHSLLASIRFKAFVARSVAPGLYRAYRLVFNLFSVLSFMPILALIALLPDRVLYRIPLPWLGVFIGGEFLAGVMLMIGFLQSRPFEFLGLSQFDPQVEKAGRLTTAGLYRFMRHPLYTSGLLLIWLIPWMTINLLTVNLALTVYIVIGATLEERKLRREFGQEYADYMAVTPMFIPFLKGNKSRRGMS